MENICYNCFSVKGEYEVCPYCGHVHVDSGEDGFVLKCGSKIWGRYIVGTVLGMGGFGITYRVWDMRLSSMVAVKEFFPQSLVSRIPGEMKVRVFSGDKQEVYKSHLAKFMDEARNLAKFTGEQHIVNVLDFFEDNGTAYIIMEFLDGITLKEHLANAGGRLSVEEAIRYETELLKALSVIHSKDIIHRDISPDNIFILKDGRLKILDFGAARFALEEGSDLSQSVVVKKGYAPPEQYRKNMKQGRWTDIYAAGATLYKMVTGITPDESIERAEKDTLKRPSHTGTLLDAAVDKTVMKSMALKPELRFKTAGSMLAALENRASFDFPEEEIRKRKRRNTALIVSSVVAVFLVAVFLLVPRESVPIVETGDDPIVTETAATSTATETEEIEPEEELIPVRQTEPLDFSTIEPCEISIALQYEYSWDEENQVELLIEPEMFAALETAFEAKYPGFDLVGEFYTHEIYSNGSQRTEYSQRLLSADSPTVFDYSSANQITDPHLSDLSPLYNTLNLEEYHLLEQSATRYANFDWAEGNLYYMPYNFYVEYLSYDSAFAEQNLIEFSPEGVDYLDVLEIAKSNPGTTYIPWYDITTLIDAAMPQIYENKDYELFEQTLTEYLELWENGTIQSEYNAVRIDMSNTFTNNIIHDRERGLDTGVPVTDADGFINYGVPSYSVSSYVDENEQKAGMMLIHFILSDEGQRIISITGREAQPLKKNILDEYVAEYPQLNFMLQDSFFDNLKRLSNYDLHIEGFDMLDDYRYASTQKEDALKLLEEQFGYWKDE